MWLLNVSYRAFKTIHPQTQLIHEKVTTDGSKQMRRERIIVVVD